MQEINKGKIRKDYHPRAVQYVPPQMFNRETKEILKKISLCRQVNIISKVGNRKKGRKQGAMGIGVLTYRQKNLCDTLL